MKTTHQFRVQHSRIIEMMRSLEDDLHVTTLTTDPAAVRRSFVQLSGKLVYHVAVEEGALYPRLMTFADQEVRGLAGHYSKEMKDLRDAFMKFIRRWVDTEAIRREPRNFIKEARNLFGQLRLRIENEGSQLYALIDNLEVVAASRPHVHG